METLTEFIIELIDEGFFDKSRTFKEIRIKVENEIGMIQHSTSYPVILNVCVKGRLSRLKNNNYYWEYVRTVQEECIQTKEDEDGN